MDFYFQIFIVLSIGAIIFILARGVAKVVEAPAMTPKANVLDRLIAKLPLKEIDLALSFFLEKFLRKFKVFVMKIDNLITGWIGRLKKPSEKTDKVEIPDKNL